MLDHEFMRLAFGAGAVVGVLAPAVGFFLVQRRMSLIGDGIGHVAFAGVALVRAAKRTGKPVRWIGTRSETLSGDHHGRAADLSGELALDARGKFLALRGTHLSNIGGYASSIVPLRKGIGICSGLYRIPAAHYRAAAVLTNTVSTTPYRSAGRPEATYIIERLCDLAARQTGIDRIALRRRNLIAPHELPYRNPVGVTYDNGAYEAAMDKALAKAGLTLDDMSVIEVNEAFATVVLQTAKDLHLEDRMADVNPNGGGISLGHPLGATGARITATLVSELERRNARYGIASMCVGFGMAIAGVVERV